MAGHDIVVIGGSAGGLEALKRLCGGLPADFPAAVFIVIHVSPGAHSVLPSLLSRAGPLPARHPRDGEAISRGTIFVAPPDRHLLVRPGHVLLRHGPHENRTRPAIDPLFRSAAVSYRSRVIGIVLSGLLDDGAAGLVAVKLCGGLGVVQQPEDAMWPDMPLNALRNDHVDHCAPVAEMPGLLTQLVRRPPGPMPPVPHSLIREAAIAAQESATSSDQSAPGKPTRLGCPQCGGVLNEVSEAGSTQFRCQVGHGFTAEGLLAAQNDELERALESALRLHRDRVALFRRMEQSAQAQSLPRTSAQWRARADESEQAAGLVARALERIRDRDDGSRARPAAE